MKAWCLPKDPDGEYVAAMEDVLDVYERPYDATRPVVCVDETSVQLVSQTRVPVAAAPRRPARQDYEYRREGVANLFVAVAPLAGVRQVTVTAQRTKADFARFVRELVEDHYPQAERVVLVLDNLNTHTRGALYDTFPPEQARRLWHKLEVHYTPKHASWLNMAEIELSVLSRQCLGRRIGSRETLAREVAAWQDRRNAQTATIEWQFTTTDARRKLKHLYPAL